MTVDDFGNVQYRLDSSLGGGFGAGDVTVSGNILPSRDYTDPLGGFNLGSSSSRWENIYVRDALVASQSIYLGETKLSSTSPGQIFISNVVDGEETEPIPLAGGGVVQVTYSELETIIGPASLTPGYYYLITDFKTCYDQPDYDINGNAITGDNYRDSDVHPLMVLAISNDKLAVDAYQPDYPKDKIKYDFTWNQTEVSGGTAYGRITERIDEFNNRTDYDHRNVRFKRYRSRFLDGTVNGRIISMNEGVIIGTGSNFDSDFTTSSEILS